MTSFERYLTPLCVGFVENKSVTLKFNLFRPVCIAQMPTFSLSSSGWGVGGGGQGLDTYK